MANVQRIREVVEYIETKVIPSEDKRFSMSDWYIATPKGFAKCGTSACLAGWTVAYADIVPPKDMPMWEDEISKRAQQWLGLDDAEADDLFYTCPELEDEADELEVVKETINDILGQKVF